MYNIIIHCNPSELDNIKAQGLQYEESPRFGFNEYDVIIPLTNEVDKLNNSLEDEEFVEHFGINYNNVNCIELI